jgi:hypothetical protein
MKYKAIFAGCLCALSYASPAMATGGISCDAKDANVEFTIQATVARAIEASVIGVEGTAMIKAASGKQAFNLSGTLAQSWIQGGEARLHFYWQAQGVEGVSGIELVIKTKGAPSKQVKSGTYSVRLYPAASNGSVRRINGKAQCELD